jgi:hypothetical protein
MEKSVKAHETKLVTARELFSMSYATRELFTENKIATMKKNLIEKMKLKHVNIEFFENEGIVFYSEKAQDLTTIDYLKDYTINSGELWKFGFINRKTGQITLLFGGNCVAKGHNEAIRYFQIAKVVTTNRFEHAEDLIPFAQKD